jgi:hypothetical protein
VWFLEVNLLALSFQRLKETTTDICNVSGNVMDEAKVEVLALSGCGYA